MTYLFQSKQVNQIAESSKKTLLEQLLQRDVVYTSDYYTDEQGKSLSSEQTSFVADIAMIISNSGRVPNIWYVLGVLKAVQINHKKQSAQYMWLNPVTYFDPLRVTSAMVELEIPQIDIYPTHGKVYSILKDYSTQVKYDRDLRRRAIQMEKVISNLYNEDLEGTLTAAGTLSLGTLEGNIRQGLSIFKHNEEFRIAVIQATTSNVYVLTPFNILLLYVKCCIRILTSPKSTGKLIGKDLLLRAITIAVGQNVEMLEHLYMGLADANEMMRVLNIKIYLDHFQIVGMQEMFGISMRALSTNEPMAFYRSIVINSYTGAGKTFMALFYAIVKGKYILIITPLPVLYTWHTLFNEINMQLQIVGVRKAPSNRKRIDPFDPEQTIKYKSFVVTYETFSKSNKNMLLKPDILNIGGKNILYGWTTTDLLIELAKEDLIVIFDEASRVGGSLKYSASSKKGGAKEKEAITNQIGTDLIYSQRHYATREISRVVNTYGIGTNSMVLALSATPGDISDNLFSFADALSMFGNFRPGTENCDDFVALLRKQDERINYYRLNNGIIDDPLVYKLQLNGDDLVERYLEYMEMLAAEPEIKNNHDICLGAYYEAFIKPLYYVATPALDRPLQEFVKVHIDQEIVDKLTEYTSEDSTVEKGKANELLQQVELSKLRAIAKAIVKLLRDNPNMKIVVFLYLKNHITVLFAFIEQAAAALNSPLLLTEPRADSKYVGRYLFQGRDFQMGKLDGDMGELFRNDVQTRFMANNNLMRVVVATYGVGSEGIDLADSYGTHPRVLIRTLHYKHQHTLQANGRVNRRNTKSCSRYIAVYSDVVSVEENFMNKMKHSEVILRIMTKVEDEEMQAMNPDDAETMDQFVAGYHEDDYKNRRCNQ